MSNDGEKIDSPGQKGGTIHAHYYGPWDGHVKENNSDQKAALFNNFTRDVREILRERGVE